jgi:hypothetical protein
MGMKTHVLRAVSLFSATSFGLIIFGCSKPERLDGDEQKHGLILRNIPEEKWNRILEVLNADSVTPDATPRKKLFRIKTYTSGNPPAEMGELDEEMLLGEFPSDQGFKGHAVQIGLGVKPDFDTYPASATRFASETSPAPSPEPSATPITLHAHFKQNLKESQIMVQKVDAILNETSTPSPSP